jgi:hypothetical protein
MVNYREKYLKYKMKYIELKKIQMGGALNDINVLYANVGRDFSTPTEGLAGLKAYCDYKNRDNILDNTSLITLDNLKKCLDYVAQQNIELLTINEFCYSKLYELILYINSDRKFNDYDIILIAQNRDNRVYNCKLKKIEGYHPHIRPLNSDEIQKDVENITTFIKSTYDREPTKYDFNSHKNDSYFKCFGFIYNRNIIDFNLIETQSKISNHLKNPALRFTKIENLLGDHVYPRNPINIDLNVQRNLYVINRFDYRLEVVSKDIISEYLLQYCAFSCFKNKITNLEFILYNTHFIGTLKDNRANWIEQYNNIIEFIKDNNKQEQTFIIGDFNIRSNYSSYETANIGIRELINSLDIEPNKFSNHINLYPCNTSCENTLLIRKNDSHITTPETCVDINIAYNCHKPIIFTINYKLSALPPQPGIGSAAVRSEVEVEAAVRPEIGTVTQQTESVQSSARPLVQSSVQSKRKYNKDLKIKKKYLDKYKEPFRFISYNDIHDDIIKKSQNTLNGKNFFQIFEEIYQIEKLTDDEKYKIVTESIKEKGKFIKKNSKKINNTLFTKLITDLLHSNVE